MNNDFLAKNILLGVCGGIAAYKSAYLVRAFVEAGACVRVVMTDSAQAFITPMTFQALSGNAVSTTLWDLDVERAMGHIELAKWADYVVIAPASANTLAKMAHGLCDDLLSTIYLATRAPVLVCPAMNQAMWHHEATRANMAVLAARGVTIVGPDSGMQACGDEGFGRLVESDAILDAIRALPAKGLLQGEHVVITAGPTEEAIDPVRVMTNHSSGKMGYALASAALMAGARVTLVSGPSAASCLPGIKKIAVKTADEMQQAVMSVIHDATLFIGAAAVCDYRVANPSPEKIKKQSHEALQLSFEKTPDILAAVANLNTVKRVIGFAAETSHVLDYAAIKLKEKKVDVMIANLVGNDLGFHENHHEVTMLFKEGHQVVLPKQHKTRLAAEIIKNLV